MLSSSAVREYTNTRFKNPVGCLLSRRHVTAYLAPDHNERDNRFFNEDPETNVLQNTFQFPRVVEQLHICFFTIRQYPWYCCTGIFCGEKGIFHTHAHV